MSYLNFPVKNNSSKICMANIFKFVLLIKIIFLFLYIYVLKIKVISIIYYNIIRDKNMIYPKEENNYE